MPAGCWVLSVAGGAMGSKNRCGPPWLTGSTGCVVLCTEEVAGLLPSQGTYGRQPIAIHLSHPSLSLFFSSLSVKSINMSSGED